MKSKFLVAFVIVPAFLLVSCLKHKPLPNYPIAGRKWQEVKLWIYHKTYHGLVFSDTTYPRSAFDTLDYIQFFNTGTVQTGSHYYYSLHAGLYNGDPAHPYFSETRGFMPWRSVYLVAPTGFNADTVYYNGRDSLRIHSFQRDVNQYYDEMDAYYTR